MLVYKVQLAGRRQLVAFDIVAANEYSVGKDYISQLKVYNVAYKHVRDREYLRLR
jgi:hypothetical protein